MKTLSSGNKFDAFSFQSADWEFCTKTPIGGAAVHFEAKSTVSITAIKPASRLFTSKV